MSLHHLTLKAAIAKYKDVPAAELSVSLKLDEKGYSDEEISEIIAAIGQPAAGESKPKVEPSKAVSSSIDLPDYNPADLKTKEKWDKYMQLIKSLPATKSYDFEKYKAKPVRRVRFEGMPGSPVDMVGLELVNSTPLHATRIPVGMANDHNAQIENAMSIAGHGTYYLLKKI